MNKKSFQEIKHKFFFETPLYEEFKIITENTDDLFPTSVQDILEGEVDAYNSASKINTTYRIDNNNLSPYAGWEGFYRVVLTCKRNDTQLLFIIVKNKDILYKIGQSPSLADIQFGEMGKKYDKLLSKEELSEFKKAIVCASHGFGSDSFVYLRRIFERLIKSTFIKNKEYFDISEEDFIKKRMIVKVEILKKYLPSQLVEMKSIYKILSEGVHELSEEECLSYFGSLKLSIELILDQQIEMENQKAKDAEVKKQIIAIGKIVLTPKQSKPKNTTVSNLK